eukprot:TRINITY_DN10032_c1_g1_i1.p2 TRINITY_DN10032_c1_g1~~TRINITY_DN10032_c1_g1_i1.p2  ORF type:complete len:308 (+),score=-23.49 TRINITY_DN10032_c1_g1_i1:159-1082(+)
MQQQKEHSNQLIQHYINEPKPTNYQHPRRLNNKHNINHSINQQKQDNNFALALLSIFQIRLFKTRNLLLTPNQDLINYSLVLVRVNILHISMHITNKGYTNCQFFQNFQGQTINTTLIIPQTNKSKITISLQHYYQFFRLDYSKLETCYLPRIKIQQTTHQYQQELTYCTYPCILPTKDTPIVSFFKKQKPTYETVKIKKPRLNEKQTIFPREQLNNPTIKTILHVNSNLISPLQQSVRILSIQFLYSIKLDISNNQLPARQQCSTTLITTILNLLHSLNKCYSIQQRQHVFIEQTQKQVDNNPHSK